MIAKRTKQRDSLNEKRPPPGCARAFSTTHQTRIRRVKETNANRTSDHAVNCHPNSCSIYFTIKRNFCKSRQRKSAVAQFNGAKE